MNPYQELAGKICGAVHLDADTRILYSTDASIYRELPSAVVFPANTDDLCTIVKWSAKFKIPLIPRTAGTSLAGQVVGGGVVVDTGRYLNRIIEIDPQNKFVWVEPGVIRDDLNKALKPYNLFFAPETSTSNRCMIGGMTGNNSCGANSLMFGSTRDHLLEVKGYLSDGSPFHALPVDQNILREKLPLRSREGEIYQFICEKLKIPEVQVEIKSNSPWPEIKRRNTGYALDILLDMNPLRTDGEPLNLSKIIAGSEGTLMMISALKLNLVPGRHLHNVMICPHFHCLNEALDANLIALKYPVKSIELIDNAIVECAVSHPGFKGHGSFIKGNPEALIFIEIAEETPDQAEDIAGAIIADLHSSRLGYHHPVLSGNEISKAMELRRAGLGLLANMKGDEKPVTFIEDTAVRPVDLPGYIADIKRMLKDHELSAAFYGHVGTGELHLKPFLDLKKPEHRDLLREISRQTALLVKKYRGSLSGEHGDGRLRGEFIPAFYGEKTYSLFRELKAAFDPEGLLNPGKITGSPAMNTSLKFCGNYHIPDFYPVFDYSDDGGFIGALERCSGSGDCRRPPWHEAVMCPSYQATNDEYFSTRGRINLLKEILTSQVNKPFSDKSLKKILDNCLSCKGCKSECPGAVDMARYKSEVLNSYHSYHPRTPGDYLVINIYHANRFWGNVPWLYNALVSVKPLALLIKYFAGIHPRRELPALSVPVLEKWIKRNSNLLSACSGTPKGKLVFYVDEFTNYYDAETGKKAILLLLHLGYEIIPFMATQSGRAAISKGALAKARSIADANVIRLRNLVSHDLPLVGIEPSALLSFVDEYPGIVSARLRKDAEDIASNTLLIEEFLVKEFENDSIVSGQFCDTNLSIVFHGHCHQKALRKSDALYKMLSIPGGYQPEEIKSGCCGMAGSFGMEKEHYHLSMKIGEQILFPRLREISDGTIVAVPGMSCRSQILHGTGIKAQHPVVILYNALIDKP